MKKNEKEALIEQLITENLTITTKQLRDLKISFHLIQEWVKEGFLLRLSRGVYSLGNSQEVKVFQEKQEKEDKKPAFQQLTEALLKEDYEKAVSFSFSIEELSKEQQKDFYFYLTLLNQFMVLSDEKKEQIKDFEQNPSFQNTLKTLKNYKVLQAFKNGSLNRAFSYLMQRCSNQINLLSQQEQIILQLIRKNMRKQKEDFKIAFQLEQERKFDELEAFLLQKRNQFDLSFQEEMALTLVQTLQTARTSKLQVNHFSKAKNVFEAISSKDYILAKNLNEEYHKNNPSDKNLLGLLLSELISLEQEQFRSEQEQNQLKAKELLPHLLSHLFEGKKEQAIQELDQFLELKQKKHLFPIVQNLIDISLLEQDFCYQKPCQTLFEIEQGTYQYQMLPYIFAFSEEVMKNPSKAKCYLQILKQGKALNQPCSLCPQLESLLKESQEKLSQVDNLQKIKMNEKRKENE